MRRDKRVSLGTTQKRFSIFRFLANVGLAKSSVLRSEYMHFDGGVEPDHVNEISNRAEKN